MNSYIVLSGNWFGQVLSIAFMLGWTYV